MRKEYVAILEGDADVTSLCRKVLRMGGFVPIDPPSLNLIMIREVFEQNRGRIAAVICGGQFNGKFNGADVVRVIREVDQEIFIIAISSDRNANSAMMAAGATVSLPKPFDCCALLGVITLQVCV